MSSKLDEQVQKLCQEIPQEKDSEKLMKLVEQLNGLLDEKEAAKSNPAGAPIPIKDVEDPMQHTPAGEADRKKRIPA